MHRKKNHFYTSLADFGEFLCDVHSSTGDVRETTCCYVVHVAVARSCRKLRAFSKFTVYERFGRGFFFDAVYSALVGILLISWLYSYFEKRLTNGIDFGKLYLERLYKRKDCDGVDRRIAFEIFGRRFSVSV